MKTRNHISFDTIIRQYNAMRQKQPDNHIQYSKSQPDLMSVIEIAAKAIDKCNKRHNHQRRISNKNLINFSKELKKHENEIKIAKSFDEIMAIVSRTKCEGIGELTKYDTATRIGAYLNINPDKVYLHSGTRVGAKNLFGRLGKKEYLLIDEIPVALHKNKLTASELEDILCIFKDQLKNLK